MVEHQIIIIMLLKVVVVVEQVLVTLIVVGPQVDHQTKSHIAVGLNIRDRGVTQQMVTILAAVVVASAVMVAINLVVQMIQDHKPVVVEQEEIFHHILV